MFQFIENPLFYDINLQSSSQSRWRLFVCIPPTTGSQTSWWSLKNMTDILSIIQGSNAHVRLEVSGEDLLAFSNDLINRAKDELTTIVEESRKERFLSKEEVKQLFGVCDATLWHWGKKNYLKPIKVGNKVRYRMSDVQKILGNATSQI